VLSFVINHYLL